MLTVKDYIVAAVAAALTTIGVWLYVENRELKSSVEALSLAKASYETAIKQAETDANKTVTKVQERVRYIEKQSEPIYKYIETYRGDANATDCDNNMSLLRSFVF